MIKGYLPKGVTYVCAKEEEIEVCYDDSDVVISTFKASSTFPVETGKNLGSAKDWTGLKNPKIVELPNEPTNNVVIAGLEERGNGGRAYKVIVDGKYYVDMREDVVLDTIFSGGIQKGGKLNGEYVWAKYGNHMKLVRFGSELYNEFVEATKVAEMVPVEKGKLVIGGIYSNRNDYHIIYLGSYYTYKYSEIRKYGGYSEDKISDQKLVKEKVFVTSTMWEHNIKSKKFSKVTPDDVFGKMGRPHEFTMTKTETKLLQQVGTVDFTGIDLVSEMRKQGDDYIRLNGKNPYARNQYWGMLCIGKDKPFDHQVITDFKIPIVKK